MNIETALEPKSTKADEPPEIDMDAVYDRISELVCLHGPMLCTRGMKDNEAAVAIMLALESLNEKVRTCSNPTR